MNLLIRIISSVLITFLCLSAVSCRGEEYPQYEAESKSAEPTERVTAALTEPTEVVTEPVTEIMITETETEAITESFPVLTGVSVDASYQYHDISTITGQTSNPNIFKTNDSATPFLYFGEDGFVQCDVEITEYPMSLTMGDITVSDIYKEYSFEGEVFFPSTRIGGGLLVGSLGDVHAEQSSLQAIHKVGDEIYCKLVHRGIHDLVVYNIGQNSFTTLHSRQNVEDAFYDTQGLPRVLPSYVTDFWGMSPTREYMLYAVSEEYGELDMDYHLYQFSTKASTLVCDEGFAADSYYGGTAGESAYWLDDRTCRIDLETDFGKGVHEFYDIFVADDGTPQIKAYPKEEARTMAFDQNDSLYRLCYRFDFHDDGGVISHLYDDSYSVTSTGLTRETFYQLFDKGESYSDFFGHSLNNGYQAKAVGKFSCFSIL